ncbi:unnamed protein product [Paramecium sonneborni]|uniref:Uncharacterized protein n=1 Tax=Paramecium sonneborni TaxID=65129 RepID=A0A8S1LB14_9CILI|nr:unnamed protein product [Paramecium sonneborni]
MKEDKSAQYVYYNLVTSSYKYKKVFGDLIECYQLKKTEKQQNKNEISVIMRFFPINFNKGKLLSIQDIRAEELFIYQGYKYGIFKAKDYEIAENFKQELLSYFQRKKYQEAHITILEKKKQKPLNNKAFMEDDCQNPREQLEQKIGISLSPPKITPQIIIKQQEQQQLKKTFIQPIISAIKISQEEQQIKQTIVKSAIIEKAEQKVIARPVQLKPLIISIDRERSSRKK